MLADAWAVALLLSLSLPGWCCGTVSAVPTGEGSQTRYSLGLPALPPTPSTQSGQFSVALVLLPGGHGHLNLDATGCARGLKGNSLVRAAPLWQQMGFFTALVDARSDWQGEDGLASFRIHPQHAQDLGKVIADVRLRSGAQQVWVVGTSRGAISAVNVASRGQNEGPQSADGLVLTSALMAGDSRARKPFVAQSVFDLPLSGVRIPTLLLGHAGDACPRSPPALMDKVAGQLAAAPRTQVKTVNGGTPGHNTGLDACEGRSHHGFWDMETDMAAGIARFVRGGSY